MSASIGDITHLAATNDIVKFLETAFICVISRVEIEILLLVLAGTAKRISRRRMRLTLDDFRRFVNGGKGMSQPYKRKREYF